jgi:hypothetical protein
MTRARARSITSRSFSALLLGSFVAWLAACSATTPQSSVAAVSASEAALAAAGKTILVCYGVPRCAAVAPKAQIRAAYDLAYDSVTRAQAIADSGGTPDMIASASALSALQALVVQLPPT